MKQIPDLNQRTSSTAGVSLPQLDKVVYCLEALWFLLFPDHRRSNKYFLAGASRDTMEAVLKDCRKELGAQVDRALGSKLSSKLNGVSVVDDFLRDLPGVKEKLIRDAEAACRRDPAATGIDEVILSYPGFLALMTYRIAHELSLRSVPLLPRMMSEYAHALTGCDIHPDARIGEELFIDHATGVVIGQTSVIGDRVTLFQGVTLGALALKSPFPAKRHPTVADDVIIYSNATILGGQTVIGKGSIIGGSCWITASVPPGSKVILSKPHMILTVTGETLEYIPNWDI